MERKPLLDKLKLVSPALSGQDLIPVLSHFWFRGKTLMAFNDYIAISTPLSTSFTGAVQGQILLNLLNASRAKTIEFSPSDKSHNILVKASKTKMELGLLPASSFVFDMPEPDAKTRFPVDPSAFLKAIKICMKSISTDTSQPDQMGVTLIVNGKQLDVFTTDNNTISWSKIFMKGTPSFKRVTLSAEFCRQMLSLASGEKELLLEIDKDHSILKVKDTILFGKLIMSRSPIDFKELIGQHVPTKLKMHPVPKHFKYIVERAVIVSEAKVDQTKTSIQINEGLMKLKSESMRGVVNDQTMIDGHPNAAIKLHARYVKAGLEDFDHILITDRCMIMNAGDHMYLVSAT